ncbi:MAG: 3-isopropylmalate dehydrogenase [Candidatus Neomarinimicrobiota bacterium]|nr:3-isopropylmalate dehydrogenase [bacterium]
MKKNIAVLPGDGIGPEVMREALKVLAKIEKKYKTAFKYEHALAGGAAWDKYGEHLPQKTLDICRRSDAILFGSVGGPVREQQHPKWAGAEVNSLLGLRKTFNLYANLRPAKLYPALASASPLREDTAKKGFDILVVRELTGGIYFGEPKGRCGEGESESAFDTMIYSRAEIRRIAHIAFRAAQSRRKKVTSVDKANVLMTMVFWREVVEEVAKEYPDVVCEPMYVDNAAQQLTLKPSQFDVMLCGNMFGDILSDEAAAITGSLGMLPSASLAENGFGMYEPGGGSAPDIAGKGIANPIAQIMSAAMMLKYSFAMNEAYADIAGAVEQVLNEGGRTADIRQPGCKTIGTEEMGSLIADKIIF